MKASHHLFIHSVTYLESNMPHTMLVTGDTKVKNKQTNNPHFFKKWNFNSIGYLLSGMYVPCQVGESLHILIMH